LAIACDEFSKRDARATSIADRIGGAKSLARTYRVTKASAGARTALTAAAAVPPDRIGWYTAVPVLALAKSATIEVGGDSRWSEQQPTFHPDERAGRQIGRSTSDSRCVVACV
jgi:ApbE superfamily uncharacterized protein (UPF0280 family)